MNRRQAVGVLWFLLLTFGLTWALWSLTWAPQIRRIPPAAGLIVALGMWGPGLSAILVLRFVLRESLRTTTIDRLGHCRYYLWAWFLPAAATLASTGLTVLAGLARLDPQFTFLQEQARAAGASLPIPPAVVVAAQVALGLTLGPLINSLFALGEELGWRGFLLPRLMAAGMGQWPALAASGAIWGLWHAPIILQGHNYPDHPYLGVLLMTVFCILLGVIFGWLQLASGSVWVPTIAHGALNAIAGLPLVILTPFDKALGGMVTSVIGWIPLLALIAWLAWTRRLPVPSKAVAVSPQ